YHASIGLIALGAALVVRAMKRIVIWSIRAMIALLIIAPLAYVTWSRTHEYKDAETLWRDTLSKNKTGCMVYVNLGKVLADKSPDDLDEAQRLYEKALELRPDLHDTHTLVAMVLGARGQNDAAIREVQKALAIKEDFAPAHYTLGQIYAHQAKLSDAIRELNRAIEIAPSYAKPHFELAKLLETKGDLQGAIDHYRIA